MIYGLLIVTSLSCFVFYYRMATLKKLLIQERSRVVQLKEELRQPSSKKESGRQGAKLVIYMPDQDLQLLGQNLRKQKQLGEPVTFSFELSPSYAQALLDQLDAHASSEA